MIATKYSPQGLAVILSEQHSKNRPPRLYIRFPRSLFGGKQKKLSLNLSDNPKNRAFAESKLAKINDDIINNCFDLSLESYKPQSKRLSHIAKLKAQSCLSINDLYKIYIEVHKDSVSKNTYKLNYLHWLNRLNSCPKSILEISQDKAFELLDYLTEKGYTANSNRRLFVQIRKCVNWATKAKKIDLIVNPYNAVLELLPENKKNKRKVPKYFERDEIIAILDAFKFSKYYSYYYEYICFLFATGARPSEVICLTWKDVDDRFITFNKRLIESEEGFIVESGLKAEDNRKFPLNELIKDILKSQRAKQLNSDLIFPSPKGKFINIRNFSRRAWKKILEQLEFKYKRPYTARASFITQTLESLDAKDVGRICGNLPETIYNHYAGSNVRSLQVPNMFKID